MDTDKLRPSVDAAILFSEPLGYEGVLEALELAKLLSENNLHFQTIGVVGFGHPPTVEIDVDITPRGRKKMWFIGQEATMGLIDKDLSSGQNPEPVEGYNT